MTDERSYTTNLSIANEEGHVEVSERGPLLPIGHFDKGDDLVDADHRIEFEIGIEEDQPAHTINFGMRSYHIENTETKRAFHAAMVVCLPLRDLVRLHAYIGFLLDSEKDGT